jgi:acetylornithine/succinyldiaminopimelate/putrescine aminotransferase
VLPFNDVDALESRVDENTCAVMIEFLQGEGGIQSATQEFVDALFKLKETYGFLVIADEVQSGIGRTGDFFSFEKYGVRPDIITVAKAMGGGLPLGAILATEEAASLLDKGMHGTTYGGNPVACVAGSVVVEEVCNGLMAHVKEIGDYLNAQLEAVRSEFPEQIREIRGRGCMQGVVVHTDAAPYVQELLKNGVIANATAGNVIRLVPPFIITTADVDELVRALRTVMSVTRG